MGDLAADTAVEGSDGRYQAALSRDWEIWGPNGGYIAAVALRAAGAYSRFDRPITLVGHFLGVADFDAPVDLDVTTLREAKRAQSVRVSMTQRMQNSAISGTTAMARCARRNTVGLPLPAAITAPTANTPPAVTTRPML